MILIGLTGPTGSGKSTASKVAEKMGFKVVDCDRLARVATEKESPALKALTEVFTEEILNSDGTLNRKMLASKAFKDSESTELLNKTVLPYIVELVVKEAKGFENVLLDAPTLFESGLQTKCDKTVVVLADKDIRLSRIISRDKISKEDAVLRINAGKTDDYYIKRADYILYNNADTDDFINGFSRVITEIKSKGE